MGADAASGYGERIEWRGDGEMNESRGSRRRGRVLTGLTVASMLSIVRCEASVEGSGGCCPEAADADADAEAEAGPRPPAAQGASWRAADSGSGARGAAPRPRSLGCVCGEGVGEGGLQQSADVPQGDTDVCCMRVPRGGEGGRVEGAEL